MLVYLLEQSLSPLDHDSLAGLPIFAFSTWNW